MDGPERHSKRRRLDHDYVQTTGNGSNDVNAADSPQSGDTSSDELAAGSGHDDEDRRRTSWSVQKPKAYTPKRSYSHREPLSDSESPDELALDADIYWRRSGSRDPRRMRSRSRSSSRASRASRRSDRSPARDRDSRDRYADDDDDVGGRVNRSHAVARTATPEPPPKPEWVNYREKYVLRGHLRGVSAVQFSPDGSMIASGSADGSVKVWDTRSGKLIHTFEGHLAGISTIAWSPDGATIASGSDDKSIRLWNVLTGKAHPVPFLGHHNYVYQIAFSPKGNMLASGSYDEAVFLWDVRSARVMRSLPAHSDPVAGIDVVRDGTLIVSCALDGLIRIWDTMTGQCLRTLVHEDNPPVTAVKFSPNGKFVMAWTLDDCVRLWDYVDGRCLKTYQGHVNRKYSLSGGFGVYGCHAGMSGGGSSSSSGGQGRVGAFAVSGSEDGTILCWDVVSKNVLQRIDGHTDVVLGVDTGTVDNRRVMVSCSLDRTIRVWEEVGDRPNSASDVEGDVDGVMEPPSESQPESDREFPRTVPQSPSLGQTTGHTTPAPVAPDMTVDRESMDGGPESDAATRLNGVRVAASDVVTIE